jgi:hypothetical protein
MHNGLHLHYLMSVQAELWVQTIFLGWQIRKIKLHQWAKQDVIYTYTYSKPPEEELWKKNSALQLLTK